jgi:alpha-L-glutamate ligase-like protein
MLELIKKFQDRGILGINQRNSELIMKYNPRSKFPLVDDKLLTKELSIKASVPVPDLYKVVRIQHEVQELGTTLSQYNDFVIKPSRGSGGEGIVVIANKAKTGWRKTDGSVVSTTELVDHVTRILSGVFSLGGQPDKALIEYRVRFDPVFEHVSYFGVPDIRIIVLLGVPIMAMLRLPTRGSGGKANLHQGAIGAGVSITNGETNFAVWKNRGISEHPDTGYELRGLKVPHWETLLLMAARTYELTGLGYQGVDFVLDKDKGPLLLEMNARPGLAIQIANNTGLLNRVKKVEEAHKAGSLGTAHERVEKALSWFA